MEIFANKEILIEETISKEYEKYSDEEKKNLHNLYHHYSQNPEKFDRMIRKLEKVIFKKRPPTMAEFLDAKNGWLPRKVIDSIWPHVKEDLLNIVDGEEKYFQISLYGSTRLGKSFMAQLLMIYTIVFMQHLRSPALYYGLSPLTKLCIYIISFKFDKSREIYLKDIYNFLENSERFVKIKFQDQVKEKQEEYGCDKIVWSKASVSGEITVASGLQILLGNKNPDEIIGANCLQIYISEIAFFINQAGASEDDIFELYTNSYSRIRATVGKNYLAWVFLDSSANFEESKIERHIIKTLQYDKDTYFRWRSQWQARPWDFKQYYKGLQEAKKNNIPEELINEELLKKGCVFQVITGNGTIPAQMVTNQAQISGISKELIDYVPIDIKTEYDNNLIKSIKDIGGKPTSNESKLIQNVKLIDALFNNTYLKNIEGGLIADAADFPEELLWKQVEQIFFHKQFNGRTQIYRAPTEPRFVGIDVAHSAKGDVYGFSIGHLEYSKLLKERMYIGDMNFVILPGSEGINLSAVEHFIIDLMTKGNLSIIALASDTFQSQQTIQDLKRMNINIIRPQLDTSLEPYIRLLTSLVTGSCKVGKNIFLKNNLKCLERVRPDNGREKIDHPKGPTVNKYFGDWNNSEAGKNAKDCSDALCSSHYAALESQVLPSTVYEEENKRCNKEIIKDDEYFKKIDEDYKKITGEFFKM
jgi:hypothetical protein